MINYETILSSYDDKLTLMQWLKKVEDALKNASLSSVTIAQPADNQAILTFVFADGSSIASPVLTLPRGEKGDKGDSPTIDTHLALDSENPVANNVITEAFDAVDRKIQITEAGLDHRIDDEVDHLDNGISSLQTQITANKVYRHEVSIAFNDPGGHIDTLKVIVTDTKATAYSSFDAFMQVYGNTQLPIMLAYDEATALSFVDVYLNHWKVTSFRISNGAILFETQDYSTIGVDTFTDNVTAL